MPRYDVVNLHIQIEIFLNINLSPQILLPCPLAVNNKHTHKLGLSCAKLRLIFPCLTRLS